MGTPSVRRFEISWRSTAPPDRLFDLLADAPGWPRWFPAVRRAEWVVPGSLRRIRIGPFRVEEEILVSERPSHHAYRIRTVIPVKHHRADVWFDADSGGTRIRWLTELTPKVPGSGRLTAAGIRFGVIRLARALTAAAETLDRPGTGGRSTAQACTGKRIGSRTTP